jgi:hypothetical protein
MTEDDRDYLWDRGGPPDPEVERLELVLAPLRYRGPAPNVPERAAGAPPGGASRMLRPLAAAAALALLGTAAWILARGGPGPAAAGWEVHATAGRVAIGGAPQATRARLAVGEWLHTPPGSSARVSVGEIGTLTVHPDSRMQLLASGPQSQRMRLEKGLIEAVITAPPRLFVVDTPSAAAIDWGCAYTLAVDGDGGGVLAVTMGFVALERDFRRVLVPSGATCRMRPGVGPGTPFVADASAALRAALDDVDAGAAGRADALATVLREARRDDAITLWHLMLRLRGAESHAVYDRLAALAPPPDGVTGEGVLAHDEPMLRAWSDEIDVFW